MLRKPPKARCSAKIGRRGRAGCCDRARDGACVRCAVIVADDRNNKLITLVVADILRYIPIRRQGICITVHVSDSVTLLLLALLLFYIFHADEATVHGRLERITRAPQLLAAVD